MKQAPRHLWGMCGVRYGIGMRVRHHGQIAHPEASIDLPRFPRWYRAHWAPVWPTSHLRVPTGASTWTLRAPARVQGAFGGDILTQHDHTILRVAYRSHGTAGAGPTLLKGQTPLHVQHHRVPNRLKCCFHTTQFHWNVSWILKIVSSWKGKPFWY